MDQIQKNNFTHYNAPSSETFKLLQKMESVLEQDAEENIWMLK
jgi:hypothetical protein